MEIIEPPIIASKIKNKDKLKFDECMDIPELAIEEVIPRKIFKMFSFEIIKK